ncbi:MAG: MFS transporter [Tatlockia sp.]|jgi:DHA1 family multidrug/chloramphenicol efflux transport protein-like MFS transporter
MAQPLIPITSKQARVFACFLVLYEFLTYIANDMIMPGMIKVVESFHGPESAIASSLTAYVLGGASLQLFLGPLSDRFGRRPVMLSGALLFFICTVIIACSNSIEQFLVARFFQGMGLCFIGVIGYATLQEIFSEMDAIRLISIMANVSTTAPLLGPVLGAVFIHYLSWRLIFVLIGLFALLALWGLWRYMPEPIGQTKLDGEKIHPVPLSPGVIASNYTNLLKNKAFMLGSIALGLMGLPCLVWIALAPVILVSEAKLTILQYGLWQIPVFGAIILGNWLLQRLTHKGTVKKILILGTLILATGFLLLFALPQISNNYLWLMPGLLLYFFGMGVSGAPLNRFILFSTPVGKGTTSALMSMIAMCIQAIGIEIGNIVYEAHRNSHFAVYCALAGLLYLVFLGGALFYTRKKLT